MAGCVEPGDALGIGAFDIDQAEELACRLEAIAKAIRAKASQRSMQLAD